MTVSHLQAPAGAPNAWMPFPKVLLFKPQFRLVTSFRKPSWNLPSASIVAAVPSELALASHTAYCVGPLCCAAGLSSPGPG